MASAIQHGVQIPHVGGQEVLKYISDLPKPTPGPDQVLVKNEFIGVNYIDTYHRAGIYPVPTPFTPGVEGAGTVEAVGSHVSALKVGDRVAYITRPPEGSYAQYSVASQAIKLPDHISFELGASTLLQGMTAVSLVTLAYPVKAGDTILVHAAAGGTGRLITQAATAAGAHVIATVSTPEKAEVAKKAGAKDIILYSSQDVVQEVQRLTGGKGVAAVYDGVGASTFDASLEVVAPNGWLLSFGGASGKVPPFDLSRLSKRNTRLMRPTLYGFIPTQEDFYSLAHKTLSLVETGQLDILIHKVYPLAEAAQAHHDLEGRGTIGKLLLKP